MNYLITVSLRNLTRQKRRNILLGTAIAIGMMILVIANAFSHGISDTMFNRIMRYVVGHVTVHFIEKGNINLPVCRDKERIHNIIKECDGGVITDYDEAIGALVKAIGNGKADNAILVGINMSKQLDEKSLKQIEEDFRVIDGSFEDLKRTDIENPTIVSEEKARYLNVKKNDILRVRFRNIYGQDQAARLTVTGIMKTSNIFMQPVIFSEVSNVKQIIGYRPYETANINIVLKDPKKNTIPLAERIYSKLAPEIAVIPALAAHYKKSFSVSVLGYKTNEQSCKKIAGLIKLASGDIRRAWTKDGVLISRALSQKLAVTAGGKIEVTYIQKFNREKITFPLTVSGIIKTAGGLDENIVLVNEEKFYDIYYDNLPTGAGEPASIVPAKDSAHLNVSTQPFAVFAKDSQWYSVLAPEWILLKRTATSDELRKKFQEIGKNKWKATLVDVQTMYESASDILKLEGVLNLITFSAVLILFFVILIGVVNTLRMTIRERTREIGTIRAIGMQKNDVRNIFILETFFLTLFASISGIILSFVAMWLLSLIPFEIQDNPLGMLLIQNRLNFLPSVTGIISNLFLILFIAVATAFFPARRAANLSPAKALRHFE